MEVIGGDNNNPRHHSDWLQPFPAIADRFTTEELSLQPFSPVCEDEFDYLQFLQDYIEVPEVSEENDRSTFADLDSAAMGLQPSPGIANEEVLSQSLSPINEDESGQYVEFLEKYLEVSEETSVENDQDQDRSTSVNVDSDQDRLPDGLQPFPASTTEDESDYLEFLRKHLEVPEDIILMENDRLDLEQQRVSGRTEKEEEYVARAEEYFRKLPPGYIFLPNDEELITNYLTRKVNNQPLPVNRIRTVALYDYHPDVLIETYCGNNGQREKQWYFFTLREGKSGKRPKRSVAGGYWKASGIDMAIMDSNGKVIGHRKGLDFYKGKQPGGTRTHWKMHEFRLEQRSPSPNSTNIAAADSNKLLQLKDWVLCKLYMKGESKKNDDHEEGRSKRRKVEQEAAEVEVVATAAIYINHGATAANSMLAADDEFHRFAAFELEDLDSWMLDCSYLGGLQN